MSDHSERENDEGNRRSLPINDIKEALIPLIADMKSDLLSTVEETVNTTIDQRFNELNEDDNVPSDDNETENVDVNALIENIVTMQKNANEASNVEPSCLDKLVDEFNPETKTGPDISEKLAILVNSLVKEGLSKEQLKTSNKYNKPKNCPELDTPKVNTLLWNTLKLETKQADLNAQKGQKLLLSAIYAMLEVCDKLAESQTDNENLTKLMHALILSMSANRQITLNRRDALRPHLDKPYQALCNPSIPITQWLFGDDLHKSVDELTKGAKISKTVQGSTRRYHPYNRNSGRGRGYKAYAGRGRGTGSSGSRKGPFLGTSQSNQSHKRTK